MNRTYLLLGAWLVTTGVWAGEPNIEPGLWEYEITTRIVEPVEMPPQTETAQECLSAEEIISGHAFLEHDEVCQVRDQRINRDSMFAYLQCPTEDGAMVYIETEMSFFGERATGTVTMTTSGASMGLVVVADMAGHRIGACLD